jgi:Nuclease-related domain
MPGKWKVTAGGASAQQKADRLRTRADKLGRQATAWETGAEREPAVGKRLADLPAGYTVLHDLRLPGADGRLDHLVVSQGGVYLVDAKKYSGHLVYSKKMLWHGRFPIIEKLETLVWEAESLGDVIGREVVPVMCFVDAVLPQPVTTLGSVIVCRASVLHTVVRSTHATMSTTELGRVLHVATQLAPPRRAGAEPFEIVPGLRSMNHTANTMGAGTELPTQLTTQPTTLPATESTTESPAQPSGDASIDAQPAFVRPTSELSDEEFWSGPKPADLSTGQFAVTTTTGQTPAISTIPPINEPGGSGGPSREPMNRRWPRRVLVALVGTVLAAASVAIVWKVSQTSETNRIKAEKTLASTTTSTTTKPRTTTVTGETTDATDSDGTAAAATTTTQLDVTRAGFSVTCPIPGAGWSLRPVWPGNQPNLAWYDFAFEQFDASFQQFAIMTAPEFTQYTPTQVPSGNARTIRIEAIFKDGTISEPVITTWTAPPDGC